MVMCWYRIGFEGGSVVISGYGAFYFYCNFKSCKACVRVSKKYLLKLQKNLK